MKRTNVYVVQTVGVTEEQWFETHDDSRPLIRSEKRYHLHSALFADPDAETVYRRVKEIDDLEHRKWLESHGIDFEASILGDQRWSPYDWAYDGEEADGIIGVNQLINNGGVGAYDENDPQGFAKFKAGVLASMVLGLADAVTAGHFGSGLERASLTLFCSVAQSEEAIWLENDSARRLNSPAVYRTFAEQRIKWISEDNDAVLDDPDSVYALYQSRVGPAAGQT
jgi:hypothetical protein